MKTITVNDCFPKWDIHRIGLSDDEGGIFHALLYLTTAEAPELPWLTNVDDMEALDLDYHGNFSGNKIVSALVRRIYRQNDDTLPWESRLTIGRLILHRYKKKWTSIYNTLVAEYNPLENYSMTERRDDEITVDTDLEVNTEGNIYAFNSSSPVPMNTGKTTTTGDGDTNKQTEGHDVTRSGNIGVTTSQQMAESEFKLREYDFYMVVFKDIDEILTNGIFKEDCL